MPAASHIIGQAEQDFTYDDAYKVQGKSELGKEDFLTLLVAQLTHQDPMNPMEDKEFTAQLAEFSSLEQLTEISEGMDTMNEGVYRQEMMSAVAFIGKDIRAVGDSISIDADGKISHLYYDLGEPIASGFINIFDMNGNLVRTENLSARQAGSYEFQWDGKDYAGKQMPEGVYMASMAAETVEGRNVMVYTDVSGEVSGVQTMGNTHYLRLKDGRMVDFMQIKEVVSPAADQPAGDTAETADAGGQSQEDASDSGTSETEAAADDGAGGEESLEEAI